jgi:catechol 2,3-dioxygenase-like lactoylglutathione lyase family enzyme
MNFLATTITFAVADPAVSAGFFARHFGFRKALDFDGGAAVEHQDGGPTLFFLRLGLEVLIPSQRYAPAKGVTIAFTVKDIQHEVARLRENGVETNAEIQQDEWGERHAQVTDPNGLVVQLVQWIDDRPY